MTEKEFKSRLLASLKKIELLLEKSIATEEGSQKSFNSVINKASSSKSKKVGDHPDYE